MKEIIKITNLSKRFLLVTRKRTLLRTIKAIALRERLSGDNWALKNISLSIEKGEKIALIGQNGSGKTTLVRIITGIYSLSSGEVIVNGQPRVLFKSGIGFNRELSVADNIYLIGSIYGIRMNILRDVLEDILLMSNLKTFMFMPLKTLSVGQIQKLAVTIFFHAKTNLFIFDESLMSVDSAFAQKCKKRFEDIFHSKKTVIITSHNSIFLKKYCTTAIWLHEGTIRMRGDIDNVIDEYERFSLQ